jgi:hypothetical protein
MKLFCITNFYVLINLKISEGSSLSCLVSSEFNFIYRCRAISAGPGSYRPLNEVVLGENVLYLTVPVGTTREW